MFLSMKRGLMGLAAIAGIGFGGAAIAAAATSGQSTSTTTVTQPGTPGTTATQPGTPGTSTSGSQGAAPFRCNGPAHGTAAHEDQEKAVTGATATKAKAAAIKAAGGGTAGAVTTDFTGRGYEVTVTKSDGSTIEIHLDRALQAVRGPGGHGGPPPGPAPSGMPGGAPSGYAPSTSSGSTE